MGTQFIENGFLVVIAYFSNSPKNKLQHVNHRFLPVFYLFSETDIGLFKGGGGQGGGWYLGLAKSIGRTPKIWHTVLRIGI